MLINNTLFVGNVVLDFPEMASTNDYAVEMLTKTKPSEGTVITAGYQWAGRGQIGSTWVAPARQNLLMSVILYPNFLAAHHQFRLNQAMSVAVADAVRNLGAPDVSVKWPNDIYLGNQKTAGLLIQNSLSGSWIQWSVVGIGLNVNQEEFDPNLPNATSMAKACAQTFVLEEVRAELCRCIEHRYLQLRSGEGAILQRDYLSNLYRFGQDACYRRPDGSVFYGRITGTDEQGKLCISHDKGEEKFGLKEIQFI